MTEDSHRFSQKLGDLPPVQERPSVQPLEQVIRHVYDGQESRPDSISFGESTKIPGVKIYVDLKKPEECVEIIDNAFVAYSYALSKMMQLKEEKPHLFPAVGK
jgi:hypothetical protein